MLATPTNWSDHFWPEQRFDSVCAVQYNVLVLTRTTFEWIISEVAILYCSLPIKRSSEMNSWKTTVSCFLNVSFYRECKKSYQITGNEISGLETCLACLAFIWLVNSINDVIFLFSQRESFKLCQHPTGRNHQIRSQGWWWSRSGRGEKSVNLVTSANYHYRDVKKVITKKKLVTFCSLLIVLLLIVPRRRAFSSGVWWMVN